MALHETNASPTVSRRDGVNQSDKTGSSQNNGRKAAGSSKKSHTDAETSTVRVHGENVGRLKSKQLEKWTNCFKDGTKDLWNHIQCINGGPNSEAAKAQFHFMQTLAELAMWNFCESKIRSFHGDLYRWVGRDFGFPEKLSTNEFFSVQSRQVIEEHLEEKASEGADDDKKTALPLPVGRDMLLQVKTNSGTYKDWTRIGNSLVIRGQTGVFAARTFHSDSVVGYMVGPLLWRSSLAGGAEPSSEAFVKAGIPCDENCRRLRDHNGHCVLVDCSTHLSSNEEDEEWSLYLGMQHACDLRREYDITDLQYAPFAKYVNAELQDDGIVKATRRIDPGKELVIGYRASDFDAVAQKSKPNSSTNSTKKRKR